jgi:hypothetical protein
MGSGAGSMAYRLDEISDLHPSLLASPLESLLDIPHFPRCLPVSEVRLDVIERD